MGTRSRFALVSASPNQLAEIAERCKPLLQDFENPINYSLVCMDAPNCKPLTVGIGLIAFQSREVFGFSRPPGFINDLLRLNATPAVARKTVWSFFGESAPEGDAKAVQAAWHDLLTTPALAIGKIASEITGESLSFLYSDTSCSSGLLRWSNGSLVAGQVYGAGGTDVLLTLKDNHAEAAIIDSAPDFNYANTVANGLREYFGDSFDIDWLLNEGPEEYQRFVLMEKKAFVTPARIET